MHDVALLVFCWLMVVATVRAGPIPHRWDGEEWICTWCGHVSPDPCNCLCPHHR